MAVKLVSMGVNFTKDVEIDKAFKDTEDKIELEYVTKYHLDIETLKTSIAKTYEKKNEMSIVLEVPKSDYKNESFQKLLKWANLPVQDKSYYRDIAINMTIAGKNEKTILFSHGRITLDIKHNTKADFVIVNIVVNQKEDMYRGVLFGLELYETYKIAIEKILNPPTMNIVVPINSKNDEYVKSEDEVEVLDNTEEMEFASSYQLDIIEMKFNGQVPLRKNNSTKVNSVWVQGVKDVKTAFVGGGLKINAIFEFKNWNGNSAHVKVEAINGENTSFSNEVKVTRSEGSGRTQYEGLPRSKTVPVSFTISGLGISGFEKKDIILKWYYKNNSGSWIYMRTIVITVYFLPGTPNLPWITNKTGDSKNPWTDVLDLLLNWGLVNQKSTTSIAKKITSYVNSRLGLQYSLDTGTGYISNTILDSIFRLTDFISSINKNSFKTINCSDCASIVSTFANILGCNLYQVMFGKAHFKCNRIKLIGNTNWDTITFRYHEVAFDGGRDYSLPIYDACLTVNENALGKEPDNITGILATGMIFSQEKTYSKAVIYSDKLYYKHLLVKNNTEDLNNAVITADIVGERRKFE